MSSREITLSRIRAALAGAGAGGPAAVERSYRTRDDREPEARIALFMEMVSDYRATVRTVAQAEVAGEVTRACAERGCRKVVLPGGFPEGWRPGGLELLRDASDLDDLASVDGVVTSCALAIADTGTIVLDGGPGQGRRALSLLPDYHLCLVGAEQVVGSVPEAVTKLRGAVAAGRPLTFISGPSATSDIELRRVEGVHGPRNLEVLVVGDRR